MYWFTAPGRFLAQRSPASDWGSFVTYVEVADHQRAIRQVHMFKNGNILRYDRSHDGDAFGSLTGLRFSLKPKWRKFYPGAEMISAAEFEKVWQGALESPVWQQQLATGLPRRAWPE